MGTFGNAWLYARKSSYRGRQKGRGRSVKEQLTSGETWCAGQQVPIAGRYIDEGSSASRLGGNVREDYERMIADIEAGDIAAGDIVVAWESSRLHRDLAVYVQLRDACWKGGVFWCINGRVYDLSRREDRKMSAYDAIQSEDEVYELSERVRRTLRANAAEGRPHARSLWGYRRVFDPDTGDLEKVVIDEGPAGVVRELYQRVAALESLTSICKDLNDRGITSPAGGVWKAGRQITVLLENASYIGKRVHLGQVAADAIWPPILALEDGSPDEETFYRVQAILRDPARRTQRDNEVKHLLSGIALCAKCGEPAWSQNRKERGYRQYYCKVCWGFSCKADPVDEYVIARVVARLSGPEAAARYAAREEGTPETKRLLGDIARWRAELADGERLVEAGELTMVRLAKVEKRLLPLIDGAERRLGDGRVDPLLAGLIRPSIEETYGVWVGLEVPQRRAVLRGLVERLVISAVGRGRKGVPPEDHVVLEWRETLKL